ncbi:MAG: electron transfer flavoprotein subunit beta/FixA family protein [Bacteroidia bacterium]|nr:electron transfer flavoprotein subunit beta/FixA family protein [Bacteroidia bacterium]
MKILVCMSVVPDTTTKIAFTDNDTKFNTDGVTFIVNPYDELALTKGLEIAEANGGTVTVCHVGTSSSDAAIRKALSIGAGEAIRIDAEPLDSQFVASQIAPIAKDYDMVITGRESIDYNGGAVCGLLGAELNWPSVNVVTEIAVADGKATIEHDIDGGREELEVTLPLVVSAQKDLCEPRIPNMKSIMQARMKPLNVVPAIEVTQQSEYHTYDLPPAKQGVKLVDANDPAALVEMLKSEKII